MLLATWMLTAGSGVAAQEQALPLVLVHRFTIAEPPSWGDVAVNLVPAQWRVGGPDGPLANAWQLQAVLGALAGVEVGGCCGAWVEGPTAYPCGFTLRGFELPGLDVDRAPASASPQAPSMRERTGADASTCAGKDIPTGDATNGEGPMRFVRIRPWLNNPGDHVRALGTTLRFQFRGMVNGLHPNKIDRASGVVVLRAWQRGRAS